MNSSSGMSQTVLCMILVGCIDIASGAILNGPRSGSSAAFASPAGVRFGGSIGRATVTCPGSRVVFGPSLWGSRKGSLLADRDVGERGAARQGNILQLKAVLADRSSDRASGDVSSCPPLLENPAGFGGHGKEYLS